MTNFAMKNRHERRFREMDRMKDNKLNMDRFAGALAKAIAVHMEKQGIDVKVTCRVTPIKKTA